MPTQDQSDRIVRNIRRIFDEKKGGLWLDQEGDFIRELSAGMAMALVTDYPEIFDLSLMIDSPVLLVRDRVVRAEDHVLETRITGVDPSRRRLELGIDPEEIREALRLIAEELLDLKAAHGADGYVMCVMCPVIGLLMRDPMGGRFGVSRGDGEVKVRSCYGLLDVAAL